LNPKMDDKQDTTPPVADAPVPVTVTENLAIAGLRATDDVNNIEAPVTWQAYLICAFAAFGGIFFGYDSGYINGVSGSNVFIVDVMGPFPPGVTPALSSSRLSLITSILSAGTFFGALIAGDVAERIGRKWTVITGCGIYIFGIVIQMITGDGNALAEIVVGRVIAGIGVGFESAIVILYMSEIVRILPCLSLPTTYLTSSAIVPKEGSRLSRGWLPILYHNRHSVGILRGLRSSFAHGR
jgi:hypothetical protein